MAEEQELRLADQVFKRHNPDRGGTAVIGIIAVVTHHEIMALGHDVDARIIKAASIRHFTDTVCGALGQRLDIVVIFHHAEAVSGSADIDMLADHRRIIDVKNALSDRDLVTGQPDDTLDESH